MALNQKILFLWQLGVLGVALSQLKMHVSLYGLTLTDGYLSVCLKRAKITAFTDYIMQCVSWKNSSCRVMEAMHADEKQQDLTDSLKLWIYVVFRKHKRKLWSQTSHWVSETTGSGGKVGNLLRENATNYEVRVLNHAAWILKTCLASLSLWSHRAPYCACTVNASLTHSQSWGL